MTRVAERPIAGNWWRFSQYELWGSYLRPAPGAELEEYDPWVGFGQEDRRTKAPYQELLALLQEVRGNFFMRGAVKPGGESRLLDWCAEHGLLGLLPHQAHSITIPAHWDLLDIDYPRPDLVQPWVSTYTRMPGGWSRLRRGYGPIELGEPGTPLSDEQYGSEIPRPRASMSHLSRSGFSADELVEENVASAWGPYFPSIPPAERATFDYPLPLTEDFWRSYGEPVSEFLEAVEELYRFVEGLRLLIADRSVSPDPEGLKYAALTSWPRLLGPVSTGIVLNEQGRPAPKAICGSLLSAYALMAVEDVGGGRIPSVCQVCGNYFTASSHKAIYCSVKCRQRAQKRAQRARQKERAQGG